MLTPTRVHVKSQPSHWMALQNSGNERGCEGVPGLQVGTSRSQGKSLQTPFCGFGETGQGGCDQTDEFCSLPYLGKNHHPVHRVGCGLGLAWVLLFFKCRGVWLASFEELITPTMGSFQPLAATLTRLKCHSELLGETPGMGRGALPATSQALHGMCPDLVLLGHWIHYRGSSLHP